jgi:hypothetical protein
MKTAILIGVNYWGTQIQLNACHRDVFHMGQLMRNFFNMEVIELLERGDTPPTKENILRVLTQHLAKMNAGDELFVYYSGHGFYLESAESEEKDKKDEVLCPTDCMTNGYIMDDTLLHMFNNTPNKGLNICFMIDACHSGTICDLPFIYDGMTTRLESNSKNMDIKNNIMSISSCQDCEVSYENNIINQGIFTNSFVKYILNLLSHQRVQTVGKKAMKSITAECIKTNTPLSGGVKTIPLELDYRCLMSIDTPAAPKSMRSTSVDAETDIKPITLDIPVWEVSAKNVQSILNKEPILDVSIKEFHNKIISNINRRVYPQNMLISFGKDREAEGPILRMKLVATQDIRPNFQFVYA